MAANHDSYTWSELSDAQRAAVLQLHVLGLDRSLHRLLDDAGCLDEAAVEHASRPVERILHSLDPAEHRARGTLEFDVAA
jgi:hypothetical protein